MACWFNMQLTLAYGYNGAPSDTRVGVAVPHLASRCFWCRYIELSLYILSRVHPLTPLKA